MAVHIPTINGGNITVATGGSAPASHPETIFTLQGGTVETYDITGTLDQQWMITNGYFNENNYRQIKTITQADIGNTVTSIGDNAFVDCKNLTSVTLPNVTNIKLGAFNGCNGLTSVTIGSGIQRIGSYAFQTDGNPVTFTIGKTVAEVQAIGHSNQDFSTNVPYSDWGLPVGSTIVCTNGTIPIE